jgi:hypothetical protein
VKKLLLEMSSFAYPFKALEINELMFTFRTVGLSPVTSRGVSVPA